MIRSVFSLFVFIAVTFFSMVSVSAQGAGLIQSDYERYAQLFALGKEPNLSHHPTEGSADWRKRYRDHRWSEYADESEKHDPILGAQVLMGIYLTQFVDHDLSSQIDNIILSKSSMSIALAENIMLSRIELYFRNNQIGVKPITLKTPVIKQVSFVLDSPTSWSKTWKKTYAVSQRTSFYSEREIEKIDKIVPNIFEVARKKVTNIQALPNKMRSEVVSTQNMFIPEYKGWAEKYISMREKLYILDELAEHFPFNWSKSEREDRVKETDLWTNKTVLKSVEKKLREEKLKLMKEKLGYDIEEDEIRTKRRLEGDRVVNSEKLLSDADESYLELRQQYLLEEAVNEYWERVEDRYNAYKYIIGIYQSSDYYKVTLQKIYHYFLAAAEQGDPIAQYHLALFLKYLGDLVTTDFDNVTTEKNVQKWLNEAANRSDWAKQRVEDLKEQIARADARTEIRKDQTKQKIEALIKIEEDKIDMVEEVLQIVQKHFSGDNKDMYGDNKPAE